MVWKDYDSAAAVEERAVYERPEYAREYHALGSLFCGFVAGRGYSAVDRRMAVGASVVGCGAFYGR